MAFVRISADTSLDFYSNTRTLFFVLALYVDLVILVASDNKILQEIKDRLMAQYKMTDHGKFIWGLQIEDLFKSGTAHLSRPESVHVSSHLQVY